MSKFGRWTAGQDLYDVLTITPEQQQMIDSLKKQKPLQKQEKAQRERIKAQGKEAEKFEKCMIGIVDALPIEYDEKEEIADKVMEYSTDFPLYAQCQSNDSGEENQWITSLLPVSLMIVDNIGGICKSVELYEKKITKKQ